MFVAKGNQSKLDQARTHKGPVVRCGKLNTSASNKGTSCAWHDQTVLSEEPGMRMCCGNIKESGQTRRLMKGNPLWQFQSFIYKVEFPHFPVGFPNSLATCTALHCFMQTFSGEYVILIKGNHYL